MAKSERLYKDSPSIKRKESGEVGVEKPSDADSEDMGLEGEGDTPGSAHEMPVKTEQLHAHERREVHQKHLKEQMDMHHRHEMEHSAHEGDKTELHAKQEKEHNDMHKRHSQEIKQMHARHDATPEGKKE